MDSLVPRFAAVQAVEKILRFERFLISSRTLVRKSDREVISTFSNRLDALKTDLYPFLGYLGPYDKEDLSAYSQRSILSSIARCFRSLDELHLHLSYVKGQWTCPETPVFR